MKKLFAAMILIVLVLCASSAMADYPERSLTSICPWGAGGGTDSCLRAFCQALEKQLGQTVVVDNRTGAGGVTGHEAIADADPDGYTFGMVTFEFVTYKAMDVSDYKSYVNYDPICRLNADPAGITVNKAWAEKNNIANLNDFIKYCKAHPGEVRMGGSSANSVWHIAGGYFMNVAGVELKMVTYPDGAASAVQAAAQGVDIEGVTVSLAEARSFIESGSLVCLGLMAENRINNEIFGNIPTCKEQGVNAFYATWRGLAFPNGVNDSIRTKMASACKEAVKDSDFVKYMTNAGLGIAYLDGAEFKAFLEQQEEKDVPAAMKAAGIEID